MQGGQGPVLLSLGRGAVWPGAELVRKCPSSFCDLVYFSALQNSFSSEPSVLLFPQPHLSCLGPAQELGSINGPSLSTGGGTAISALLMLPKPFFV